MGQLSMVLLTIGPILGMPKNVRSLKMERLSLKLINHQRLRDTALMRVPIMRLGHYQWTVFQRHSLLNA